MICLTRTAHTKFARRSLVVLECMVARKRRLWILSPAASTFKEWISSWPAWRKSKDYSAATVSEHIWAFVLFCARCPRTATVHQLDSVAASWMTADSTSPAPTQAFCCSLDVMPITQMISPWLFFTDMRKLPLKPQTEDIIQLFSQAE